MRRSYKQTKASKVFECLRQDIITGKLPPEERLQMDALKQRYGVGFSPLREALSRLVVGGLVYTEEQCGYFVAPLSLEDFYDLYQIRIKIEELALSASIEKGDDQWESDVVAVWHRYAKSLNPNLTKKLDPAHFGCLQKEFRYTLIKACGSPWLLKIRDLLHDQALRYRLLCLNNNTSNTKMRLLMIRQNEQLVAAVLKKDIKKALKLSNESWKISIKSIADILKNNQLK